jgi:hypothetical protein
MLKKEMTLFGRSFPRWYAAAAGGALLLLILLIPLFSILRGFFLFGSAQFGRSSQLYAVDDGFYGYGAGGGEYAYDLAEESLYAAQAPAVPGAVADFDDNAGGSEFVVGNSTFATPGASTATTDRLIIRNGSITMEVEDTIATRGAVENLVAEYAGRGAFIVSANESGNTGLGSPYVYMTIRVPSENFDEIMAELAGMAVEVNERYESADDVTAEFVDLEARLEAMEAARQRLLEIMLNADTTEDLLRAEQQLTQREAEIEAIKGRMQYLSTSARLSSISINLTPYIVSQPVDANFDILRVIRRAVDDLLDNLQDFVESAIRFIIIGLPVLLIWLGVLYLIFRALRFIWRRLFKPMFMSDKTEEKTG